MSAREVRQGSASKIRVLDSLETSHTPELFAVLNLAGSAARVAGIMWADLQGYRDLKKWLYSLN